MVSHEHIRHHRPHAKWESQGEENMRHCHSSSSANRAWTRPFLLIVALCMLAAWPALAQSSDSVTLSGQTPKQVVEGSATLVGHYNPNQMLRLVVGIQPPNMAEEKQFLDQLQTKGSPQFHHFLTSDEWDARFAPSVEDEQAVVDWAKSAGFTVTQRYANRLIVDVEAPSATIEKALGVTMNSYQLGGTTYFSNDRDPMIPANLSGTVQSIMGLNSLQVLHPMNKNTKEPAFADYAPGAIVSAGPPEGGGGGSRSLLKAAMKKSAAKGPISNITNGAYDPTDMYSSQAYDTNALYALGHCCNPLGTSGGTPPESSIAVATAGAQQPSDFQGFHNQYPYLAWHYVITYIDGTPSCCDGEGTMDFEWATAYSNSFGAEDNTSTVHMFDGVNAGIGTFTDVYNAILSDNTTRVFTTSWGCQETACWSNSSMSTDDAIFSKMAGMGWTLFAASGDHGATPSCTDSVGVMFPASDPNVVGAGGDTTILTSGPVFVSQTAWTGGPYGCALGDPTVNDGGSTGGYSDYWPVPSYQTPLNLGSSYKGVPDISLNADWVNAPQNMYFEGALQGNGGTSIVAPSMAGFIANANAYLDSLGDICGTPDALCTPLGNIDYTLYAQGHFGGGSHDPYYDVTTGCNNNDVTAFYGTGYFCTLPAWDPVTGWGFINMLQMAYDLNYFAVPDIGSPTITFGGPAVGVWYNTDQLIDWDVNDVVTSPSGWPGTGIAGYTEGWDSIPSDPYSEANPGSGNSFYSGPQKVNSGFGCIDITGALCTGQSVSGQGWHTVYVMGWNNMGFNTGINAYGQIGWDTINPITTGTATGTLVGGSFENLATVTLTATDPGYTSSPQTGSGVASTVYQVNGGTVTTYTGSFAVSRDGLNTVTFHSTDHAGNVEGTETISFGVTASTTVSLTSNHNPSYKGESVTFTAVVTPAIAGTPTGTVTFKNGGTTLGTKTLSGGKATLATTALPTGTDTITATFNGSTYFLPSSPAPLAQVVKGSETTTTVTSSANPSVYGEAVTFTATITSTGTGETGTVTFKNGSVTLGTGTVSSGKATYTTSATALTVSAAGHSITAVYSGDSNFLGSTSAILKQIVDKATTSTTVKSSLNPSTSGQTVTFTATVKETAPSTVTPTGTVDFMDGATKIGSHALAGGIAAFSTSKLASGKHNITAVYVGDADDSTSTSTVLVQTVNP
jgi:hypothetical protein